MTKDATIRPASIFFDLNAACSVKRYALDTKLDNGTTATAPVERDDGQFVSYEDYQKALELVQRREAVIQILEGEVHELTGQTEAVGAGGVSQGTRLDLRERLTPYLRACEHAWLVAQKEGTPENGRAFDDARERFWGAL